MEYDKDTDRIHIFRTLIVVPPGTSEGLCGVCAEFRGNAWVSTLNFLVVRFNKRVTTKGSTREIEVNFKTIKYFG